MKISMSVHPCRARQIVLLVPAGMRAECFHGFYGHILPDLSVGSKFLGEDGEEAFILTGKTWLPGRHAARALLLQALCENDECGERCYAIRKDGYAVACVTLSDKGAAGDREDTAGPLMARLLSGSLRTAFVQNYILPDDLNALRGLLADLALAQGYDLICTSGGTGLGPRDITPQATSSLLDLHLPGLCQAMMAASLAQTPRGAISRATAGVIGKCLVINLPGSARAVNENLSPVLPALEHALGKLNGDQADCGA